MSVHNACRHFTGLHNQRCKAGIRYDMVRDGNAPPPLNCPCWKDSTLNNCPYQSWRTPEEVQVLLEEIDARLPALIESIAGGRCDPCGEPVDGRF